MAWRLFRNESRATAGVLGLVALMGLFVAAGVAGAHATSAGTLAAPLHAPAASKIAPASVHPAVPDATGVAISNGAFPTWITPGSLTLYWNLTVFGANVSLNSSTANQSVMMIAEIGNTQPYQDVPYASWAVPIVTGQANYQSNISTTTVLPFTSTWVFPPHTWLSDGRYFFAVFFTAANNSSGATFTSVSTTGDTQMLIGGHAAWASLDVPNPAGLPISTGNYSVVASYGGDWVIGSTLSITNPTGTVVFTANITQPGAGAGVANFTVVLTANWLIAEAGIYNATLTDVVGYNSTAHPSHSWSWTYAITVVASSVFKPVYLNQTTYTNTSGASTQLIGGVSPGATAAILMVTGVIIGLIVALVLGRMMWGGTPASSTPAQPWSGSKGSNECSVCHQTFASEQEMKDHAKTAHGM